MRSPIPLEDFEPSARALDEAVTLPPGAYTSKEFYDFELAAVWDGSWTCVGRGDQIPNPGDWFSLPANVATQVGLRSRFAPRGELAQGDIFLAQFNQWLLERYEAAEA